MNKFLFRKKKKKRGEGKGRKWKFKPNSIPPRGGISFSKKEKRRRGMKDKKMKAGSLNALTNSFLNRNSKLDSLVWKKKKEGGEEKTRKWRASVNYTKRIKESFSKSKFKLNSTPPYEEIKKYLFRRKKKKREKDEKVKIQTKLDSSSWRNIFFEKRKKKEGMKDKKMKGRSANTLRNPFLNRNSN